MKMYSALVKDNGKVKFIKNQEYNTKSEFISDLRANGYSVNVKKVKPADVFDYICEHTNMNSWDWEIREVPKE